MYERWEPLSPPLEKAFKKSVSVGEITIYQANLSGTTALALTNKAVYLLHKHWWRTQCVEVPLHDLAEVALESRDKIQLVTKNGRRHTLTVAQENFPKGLKAVNRVLELVEKL
jgi:hypothetical protein